MVGRALRYNIVSPLGRYLAGSCCVAPVDCLAIPDSALYPTMMSIYGSCRMISRLQESDPYLGQNISQLPIRKTPIYLIAAGVKKRLSDTCHRYSWTPAEPIQPLATLTQSTHTETHFCEYKGVMQYASSACTSFFSREIPLNTKHHWWRIRGVAGVREVARNVL